ncbi:GNAT family N-acetyltransferase [Ciceribacter thiooxidans]|uniref:GNAT family N-acetyltransferase n=1 Tax=Ciceribacter thiooxidans TaxID=1969821 RepID=A0ABV7IB11_9HYPH|nr:GNAT family N-acetyltransferase [Ciceribacter thiooxidans]
MEARVSDSLVVDTFRMRLADIADVDLSQLHALSIAVGWPHRAEDWRFLLDIGRGFAALDEIDRVLGSAMWFPHGDDFATIGMVITSPRLQTNGAAQWLMRKLISGEFGKRRLRLNATRAAYRLYLSLGFSPRATVYQCQGDARPMPNAPHIPAGLTLRELSPADLDQMTALDAPAFAAARPLHLARLFEESVSYGLFRGQNLRAFSMCRRFGRGHVIGPVTALNEEEAIAVLHPHVTAHAGTFLRLDTHFKTGTFANFVQQCGLPVFDTVTTMTLGEHADYGPSEDGEAMVFTLASQSMG